MRLVTYDRGGARRLGAWVGETVVDLPDAVGHPAFPRTMEALVARHGGSTLDAAREVLAHPGCVEERGVPNARLLVPFLAVPSRLPNILAPMERLPWPRRARGLVCDLRLACILGSAGGNLSERTAPTIVFGYTLMSRWSALDGLRSRGRLPGARKPLAVSLGPSIATRDDADSCEYDLVVRVDGEVWFRTDLPSARRMLLQTLAERSRRRELGPGQIYWWAPPRRHGRRALVPPGAIVEIEAEGIGRLRHEVGTPTRARPGRADR